MNFKRHGIFLIPFFFFMKFSFHLKFKNSLKEFDEIYFIFQF